MVDAYIPDLKYGNESCGRQLSLCKWYFANAGSAMQKMLEQRVPVIVRILVLPGHFECCHLPVLEKLAWLNSEWLFLSVRGQYCPDWNIGPAYGALNRRPTREEKCGTPRSATARTQVNALKGGWCRQQVQKSKSMTGETSTLLFGSR
ncbi:MAG: hypothetical protein ACRESZ_22790 [Methylococcales bacterium]